MFYLKKMLIILNFIIETSYTKQPSIIIFLKKTFLFRIFIFNLYYLISIKFSLDFFISIL